MSKPNGNTINADNFKQLYLKEIVFPASSLADFALNTTNQDRHEKNIQQSPVSQQSYFFSSCTLSLPLLCFGWCNF